MAGGASGAFVGISDGWKYIEPAPEGRWPETYYPGGPTSKEYQLYNLNEDPGEQRNLFQEDSEKVQHLRAIIKRVNSQGKTEGI